MYICTYITWLYFSYLSVCLSVEQVPLWCVPDQWLWRWDDVSPREWRTLLRSIHPYEGGSGNSPQKVKHSGAGVKAILKDKSRNTGKATHRYCVLHSVRQGYSQVLVYYIRSDNFLTSILSISVLITMYINKFE